MAASSPTPYVPFSRRAEWAGLVTIPQPEAPGGVPPVVPIDYPDEYREATEYLRAVMAAGETSERALTLTAEVIGMNAAHYTAWYYRRRCLEALVTEATEEEAYRRELEYTARVAAENPKNYQVWFHRQAIMARFQDPAGELAHVAEALEEDAKNYHVWAYRQWLLRTFSLWEGELDFVAALLELDRRNNSAWNQRWFVVATHELPKCKEGSAEEAAVGAREVAFAMGHIEGSGDLGNESPWHYLRGHLRRVKFDWARLGAPDLKTRLVDMAATEAGRRCVPLQALLVELYEKEGGEAGLEEAAQICETLGTELDPIRVRYWLGAVQARIHRRLVADLGSPSASASASASTV